MLIFIIDCFLNFNVRGTGTRRSLKSLLLLWFLSCVWRLLHRNRWTKDFSKLVWVKFRLHDWKSKFQIALRSSVSMIATRGGLWFSIFVRSSHDCGVVVERRWHSYRIMSLTCDSNYSSLKTFLLRLSIGRIWTLTVVWFATVDVVDMLCCGALACFQCNNSNVENTTVRVVLIVAWAKCND